jgi:hypothetical protein
MKNSTQSQDKKLVIRKKIIKNYSLKSKDGGFETNPTSISISSSFF